MKEKVYLQITSGRGPAECCRVVALVLERIVRQAQASGLKMEMIEREVGPVNRTLLSATIALQGAASGELADEWEGTVQWIAQSPKPVSHLSQAEKLVCRCAFVCVVGESGGYRKRFPL